MIYVAGIRGTAFLIFSVVDKRLLCHDLDRLLVYFSCRSTASTITDVQSPEGVLAEARPRACVHAHSHRNERAEDHTINFIPAMTIWR